MLPDRHTGGLIKLTQRKCKIIKFEILLIFFQRLYKKYGISRITSIKTM